MPSTDDHLKCGDKLGRLVPKLEADVIKCHAKLAKADLALADPPFDYQECEAKGAREARPRDGRTDREGHLPAMPRRRRATHPRHRRDRPSGRRQRRQLRVPRRPHFISAACSLDRPTLITLGLRVLISGDADHDATVAVRWMEVTEEEEPINMQSFKDALVKKERSMARSPLRRANTEKKDGAAGPD